MESLLAAQAACRGVGQGRGDLPVVSRKAIPCSFFSSPSKPDTGERNGSGEEQELPAPAPRRWKRLRVLYCSGPRLSDGDTVKNRFQASCSPDILVSLNWAGPRNPCFNK